MNLQGLYILLIPRFGRSAATTYCSLRKAGETAAFAYRQTRQQIARLGRDYPGGFDCCPFRRARSSAPQEPFTLQMQ